MRSRLQPILLSFVLALMFGGFARPTHAAPIPCYCRYGATHTDFENSNASTAKAYCPNEVYLWGSVPGDGGATSACSDACASDGTSFAGITSVSSSQWASSKYASNWVNMVTDEDNLCVFTAFANSETRPDHWEEGYQGCQEPMNSVIGEGGWPAACSYCYCKFKETSPKPTCAGKSFFLKATSFPGKCQTLCTTVGQDPLPPADSYNDYCNYKYEDGCTAPTNPNGAGCAAALTTQGQQQAQAVFQANQGSALGQLLPLGDLELPKLIGRIIRQVVGIVGALALVFFIWGGVKYMTAAGDDKKVKEGRDMIVAAVSGLAAIFLSYAILTLIINALK